MSKNFQIDTSGAVHRGHCYDNGCNAITVFILSLINHVFTPCYDIHVVCLCVCGRLVTTRIMLNIVG